MRPAAVDQEAWPGIAQHVRGALEALQRCLPEITAGAEVSGQHALHVVVMDPAARCDQEGTW